MILLEWQVRDTSSGSGSIAQTHARVKLPLLDALGLMEYQIIPLSCKCGKIPRFISPPALTADHQLLIHWRCTRCRQYVYFLKPLFDCWKACPAEGKKESNDGETTQDRRFLRSLGVKDPDE